MRRDQDGQLRLGLGMDTGLATGWEPHCELQGELSRERYP